MTQCWSEGELRAFLDGELPYRDIERVAAHLKECALCSGRHAELVRRAEFVGRWMETLPETQAPVRVPVLPRRVPAGRRWIAGAAGLAATLVLATVLVPKHPRGAMVVERPSPSVGAPSAPSPAAGQPAIIRREPRKRVEPPKPKPQLQYFVALDNEPIETGVVVRVGLEAGEIPADVIVGPDGRVRAFRLVSDVSGEDK